MYAVLDEVDRNAVLDLIAVAPGPVIVRRVGGEWYEDPTWASILRSARPPKVVPVNGDMTDGIVSQVDEATQGEEFQPTNARRYVSATIADAALRADLAGADLLPILAKGAASAVNEATGRMPAQLKRYWQYGKGAAKIRWGTPGAMTRCARHLAKYVGPQRAYQTCNNLSKPLGGKGVAWDVG